MSKLLTALRALALVALAPAATLSAQIVGTTPANSPFQDIKASQHLTLFGGYFRPQHDEIGATPQGGPTFGLRWEIPVAGPADFFIRAQRVNSHRTSYDPSQPAATRNLGDHSLGMYLADLGFAFDLTGRKTWHGIIPVVDFGLGVVSAAGKTSTKDPYDFGNQFLINFDAGLRIVPSGSYELRLMAGTSFYQNHYPAAYFIPPSSSIAPLLPLSTAKSGFRSALNVTAGLAVPLFR
jgi:hypothetical protein